MEHEQNETVKLIENTQLEKFTFTWAIQHFSSLNGGRICSEIFTVGGHKWRLLIFPKGSHNVHCLSIYLDVPNSATLPHGWSKCADFSLAVVNQIDPQLTIKKETNHLFNTQESGWGFPSFISLRNVHDLTKGYLVDDTLIVEAEVSAQRVIDCQADGFRKQTGLDGLTNQETTGQSEAVSLSTVYVCAGQSETVSPSRSSEDIGATLGENDYYEIYIHGSYHEGDIPKRPKKQKDGEGETHNVQWRGVLPEGPKGTLGKTMTEAQIMIVLGDITRGLIPTTLEDPRWPSSAGEMAQTFAPVVKLADEFRAMKEEVQRLCTRVMTLSDVMKLLVREGVTNP